MLLKGGTVFDGSGADGVLADVRVAEGRVVEVGPDLAPDGEVLDCTGKWVCPGFIDLHTHYEAEIEVAPALTESVRHGVTTVLLGSCGLSMAVGEPEPLADMFCRVEGIPRSVVLPLIERIKDWEGPRGYLEHLERLPLGPNVTCLLGHSTIRAAAMGLERSLSAGVRPDEAEWARMEALLGEALDAGYLGLSINTLPWDKMDGEAFRSRPTPSVFAGWREYLRLMRTLRQRGAILQAVPNLATRLNVPLFFLCATGLFSRPLRMTLIALLDPKSDRLAPVLVGGLLRLVNRWLGADMRFQTLPNPFDLWTDGLEVPVMEEIGAGTRALHETDPQERARLLRDPGFRVRFKKDWNRSFPGRAYHRDLSETEILDCPDASVVGKSFAQVAADRGQDPLDCFLDLQAEHGDRLRWYTVVANDQPERVDWLVSHPDVLIGFSDAGAHLRNMAYYNFPLRLLHRVKASHEAGTPLMSVGRAVHRLTGELGDWLGIDAGHLAPGRRADIAVIDPDGLTDEVHRATEAPMEGFQLQRVVRRNDAAVPWVLVNGRLAWDHGERCADFGERPGFGAVLRARG